MSLLNHAYALRFSSLLVAGERVNGIDGHTAPHIAPHTAPHTAPQTAKKNTMESRILLPPPRFRQPEAPKTHPSTAEEERGESRTTGNAPINDTTDYGDLASTVFSDDDGPIMIDDSPPKKKGEKRSTC